LVSLREIGLKVDGFIDSNKAKQGEIIETLRIYALDILIGKHTPKPFVIVGVIIPRYIDEITAHLKALGYTPEHDCISYKLI